MPSLSAQGWCAPRLGYSPPARPVAHQPSSLIPTTDRPATSGKVGGTPRRPVCKRRGLTLGEITCGESRPRRRARIQWPPSGLEHLSNQPRVSSSERDTYIGGTTDALQYSGARTVDPFAVFACVSERGREVGEVFERASDVDEFCVADLADSGDPRPTPVQGDVRDVRGVLP